MCWFNPQSQTYRGPRHPPAKAAGAPAAASSSTELVPVGSKTAQAGAAKRAHAAVAAGAGSPLAIASPFFATPSEQLEEEAGRPRAGAGIAAAATSSMEFLDGRLMHAMRLCCSVALSRLRQHQRLLLGLQGGHVVCCEGCEAVALILAL